MHDHGLSTDDDTTPRETQIAQPSTANPLAPNADRDAIARSGPGHADSGAWWADVILTASLTNGIARVAHGRQESLQLIDRILTTEHTEWETTLAVGEVEYHTTSQGPFPNHQLRISVSPRAGLAALNYTDHDAAESMMNSFNPARPTPDVDLIFSGATGGVFPRTAAIPIKNAREALIEWIEARRRPTCIQWRPYDSY